MPESLDKNMKIIIIAVFLLLASYTKASAYCSEPSEPYCISMSFSSFNSESEFNTCKMEVENYIAELKSYHSCITREMNQKIDEAIEKFNHKASL